MEEIESKKRPDRSAYHKAWYAANRERLLVLNRDRRRAARAANPEKIREQERRYKAKAYHADPLKHRAQRLKCMYGLSQDEYEAMLLKQKGLCAICGGKCRHENLSVDHCHATGAVRGLLCENCNRGLGLMMDSPELLRLAASYLEEAKARGSA